MANGLKIIPFIKTAEGGWVNDPNDAGGETNKGITYSVWVANFGNTHSRFMTMSDADWFLIFKKNYWDKILGDQIKSQRIAYMIVDWVWGAGIHYPEADVQDILIHSFGKQITEDGQFGSLTIDALNQVNEPTLYNDIIEKRKWFFNQCVISHPTNQRFLQGWNNRLNNLIKFNASN